MTLTANMGDDSSPLEPDAQDVAWMAQVRGGDDDAMEAFRLLVECHQNRVIGMISKMLGGDHGEAQDLAQQVFVRVWQSAARYEPRAKFTTWLFKITRNLVFNEMRRRRRHPTTPLDREVSDHAPELHDPSITPPDRSLLESELQEAIRRAIAELPEAQRMAVVLRRYEDLSYEEIAVVLKLSVPAVKSLLFRARTELREKLGRYMAG